MSDDADQESRTEAPSGKRISEAREEGRVPIGHDIVMAAGLVAGAAALAFLAGPLRNGLVDLISQSVSSVDHTPFRDVGGLAVRPAAAALAVCAAAGLATALATVIQTGGGFWGHLALPDFTKLFQPSRLGRLFEKDFAFDLLLALAKVAAVTAAAWSTFQREMSRMPALVTAEPAAQLETAFRMLLALGKPVLVAALVLAGAEYALSRWRFFKKMRMTKEETKREFKEEEGDPLIKGKRKRKHRELVKNQARAEVPRADALVVNPTHIAIAIRYRKDEGRAPRVTAKGKGELAEYMRNLARENGVPIVQDVPLARLLYRKVKVGRGDPFPDLQGRGRHPGLRLPRHGPP
ncbi:MAG: EscU/YscU/HrcU family type III secretion system export apparatus switch protein [Anaeromyxobacter sp.]